MRTRRFRTVDPVQRKVESVGEAIRARPAGKSIGWLAGQVKRVRQNARVLPEGDHLHITFPDWFGAPVIGGAKAAGLVNPNAGR